MIVIAIHQIIYIVPIKTLQFNRLFTTTKWSFTRSYHSHDYASRYSLAFPGLLQTNSTWIVKVLRLTQLLIVVRGFSIRLVCT